VAPAVRGSGRLSGQLSCAVRDGDSMQGWAQEKALPGWLPACPPQPSAGLPGSGGCCPREAAKGWAGGSWARLHWKSEIKWSGKSEVMLLVIKCLVQHYPRACIL